VTPLLIDEMNPFTIGKLQHGGILGGSFYGLQPSTRPSRADVS
jgi:hypothetical protein